MGAARVISIGLLLGVAVLAHFALSKQAEWSGLISQDTVFNKRTLLLRNTNIPISLPSTGFAKVDNYFSFMVNFFWAASDPRNVRGTLQATQIVGTLGSAWFLMLVEAHRNNGSAFLVVLTYLMEVVGELLGVGMSTPVWCVLHLLLTKIPTSRSDLHGSVKTFRPLGYALVFGYLVPTLAMGETKPTGEGLASWQLWVVARLFHPVWIFGFLQVFKVVQAVTGTGERETKGGNDERKLSVVRKFYIFSILSSAFSHGSFLGQLMSQRKNAGWLGSGKPTIDPRSVLVPAVFWGADAQYSLSKPVPFETGVAIFLQWDNLCLALSIVTWAAFLYIEAGSRDRSTRLVNIFNVFLQASGVTLLAGPGAAAAYLLMQRDAAVATNSLEVDTVRKIQ